MALSPSQVDYNKYHHREMVTSSPEASPRTNGLLLANEQQTTDILEPHHNDVLCGRGVTTNRHPGNESFRRLVSLNKELYVTSTKRQKMAISRSIVEAVRTLDPPGRFLDKDPVTGRWSEVGHKKAVEKTSQALRDGAASLRKQLSADLGDPDFLNAVFHADDEEMDTTGSGDAKANKTSSSSPKQIKKETVDGGSTTTEDGRKVDDSSVTPTVVSADHLKSSKEKTKTTIKAKKLKAKEAPVKAKKGHRRTRSTPNVGTAIASKRAQRRSPPREPPPSPIMRYAENFVHEPPSPRSPPPRHSASHPNSPMTWGGRIRFDEGQSPGSLGSIPHGSHSPYHGEPSSPHPSSPYGQHYSRGGGDYRWEPPAPRGWAKKPSRYQNYPGHPSPTSRHAPPTSPRPPSTQQASPHSPLPSGPLKPGRHTFSPSGYQSNPPPPEYPEDYHYSPDYPPREYYEPELPTPEWSPRMVKYRRSPNSRFPPPRHYSSRHHPYGGGEYSHSEPPHSPRWGGAPPPPSDPYSSGGEYSPHSTIHSPSLSVPALGMESKHSPHRGHLSPRVMLSPRSQHSSPYRSEIPPRPPPSQPTFSSSDDFSPPPPSPRYHLVNRSSSDYFSSSTGRAHHMPDRRSSSSDHHHHYMRSGSPVAEEKKTDSGHEKYERSYTPDSTSTPLVTLSNTHEKRGPRSLQHHHNMDDKEPLAGEKIDFPINQDLENGGRPNLKEEDDEMPVYKDECDPTPVPVTSAASDPADPANDGDNSNNRPAEGKADTPVEDIQMSPIPFDREDPSTLMELPENIMTLPISPCGPKDR